MSILFSSIKQSDKKKIDMPFWACAEHNGKLYFSAWLINGLCSLDLRSGKILYYERFEIECAEKYLHIKAVKYKNEIWFIPFMGDFISIVNIDTLEIKYIKLPQVNNCQYKFCTVIEEDDQYLWLIPWKYDNIIKLNLKTKAFCDIEDNPIHYIKKAESTFYLDAVKVGHDIWMFPQEADKIYVYDIIAKKTRELPWRHGKGIVNKMIYAGGAVWFLPTIKSTNIIKRDLLTGEETYFSLPEEDLDKISERSYILDYIDNWIWIAPFEGRNFIRIDICTGKMEEMTELHRKACLAGIPYERFQISYKTDECLFFLSDWEGAAMFMYHKNSGKVLFYELSISFEEYSKYLVIRADRLFDEKTISLSNYVAGLIQKKTAINDFLNSNCIKSTGNRIWNRLCEHGKECCIERSEGKRDGSTSG